MELIALFTQAISLAHEGDCFGAKGARLALTLRNMNDQYFTTSVYPLNVTTLCHSEGNEKSLRPTQQIMQFWGLNTFQLRVCVPKITRCCGKASEILRRMARRAAAEDCAPQNLS